MNEREWREQLKSGDEVLIPTRYGDGYTLHTVDRTTPTQIILGMRRFSKKDGSLIGGAAYYTTRIVMPTDKIRKETELAALKKHAASLRDKLVIPDGKEDVERFIAALQSLAKP